MPIQDNRYCTQIDFTVTRGHKQADLMFTVLMHYNRGGKTDMTASQLITRAYESYDPSEPEEVTMFYDLQTRAASLMKRYNIHDRKALNRLLREMSPDELDDSVILTEPRKKFFRFDTEDPATEGLTDALESVRYRDRANVINRWLYQYFAHGNSDYYNALSSDQLLYWLLEETRFSGITEREKLNFITESIWSIIGGISPVKEASVSTEDNGSEDRLRKAMGLI